MKPYPMWVHSSFRNFISLVSAFRVKLPLQSGKIQSIVCGINDNVCNDFPCDDNWDMSEFYFIIHPMHSCELPFISETRSVGLVYPSREKGFRITIESTEETVDATASMTSYPPSFPFRGNIDYDKYVCGVFCRIQGLIARKVSFRANDSDSDSDSLFFSTTRLSFILQSTPPPISVHFDAFPLSKTKISFMNTGTTSSFVRETQERRKEHEFLSASANGNGSIHLGCLDKFLSAMGTMRSRSNHD